MVRRGHALGRGRLPLLIRAARPAPTLAALALVWSLVRLSAWFPAYPSALVPLSVSACLLAVWAGTVLAARRAPAITPVLLALLLFLVLRGALVDALVVVLLVGSIREAPDARALELALMLSAVALGVLAAVFLATREPTAYTAMLRFRGPPGDPNDTAQVALLGLTPALFALHGGPRRRWIPTLAALALGALAVVATQSRAASAIAALLVVAAAVVHYRHGARATATTLIGACALAAALAPRRFWFRAWRLVTGEDVGHRPELARIGWAMFRESPLLGAGTGTFPDHAGGLTAHNLAVEVLAEGGVLLAIVFALLVVLSVRAAVRAWRTHPTLALLGPLALLLACTGPMDSRVLAICLGVTVVAASLTESIGSGKQST